MQFSRESLATSPKHTVQGDSLIGNALKSTIAMNPIVTDARTPASATMGEKPTLARRRSAQATIPKLELGRNLRRPPAAMALALIVDQPEKEAPTSPHRPSRTSPIPIPARRRHGEDSRPATPLTAREEKVAYFPHVYETSPQKLQISSSLRPGLSTTKAKSPSARLTAWERGHYPTNTVHQLNEVPTHSEPYPSMPLRNIERPSSPLAVASKPLSSLSAGLQVQRSTKPGKITLPPPQGKYHPLNYQSPISSARNTSVTASIINRTPYITKHQRQGSDARKELQEQQLAVIRNITRGSDGPGGANGSNTSTPRAPHLLPRGSPGPATPLELEEQLDYLTQHLRKLPLTEGQSRDAVDKIIRQETERSTGFHPDSSSSSPALSPAA